MPPQEICFKSKLLCLSDGRKAVDLKRLLLKAQKFSSELYGVHEEDFSGVGLRGHSVIDTCAAHMHTVFSGGSRTSSVRAQFLCRSDGRVKGRKAQAWWYFCFTMC